MAVPASIRFHYTSILIKQLFTIFLYMNMYIWYRNTHLYEGLVHAVIAKYWSFNLWRISSVVLGQIFPLKIFGEHGGLLGKPESSDTLFVYKY